MPSGRSGLMADATRGCVSVRGDTYANLQSYCAKHGVAIRDVMTVILADVVTPKRRNPRTRPPVDLDVSADLHMQVFEAAFYDRDTMSNTLDRSINAMLDQLEQEGRLS